MKKLTLQIAQCHKELFSGLTFWSELPRFEIFKRVRVAQFLGFTILQNRQNTKVNEDPSTTSRPWELLNLGDHETSTLKP